ncbi:MULTISPECIES: hypothetical protein [Myxococcus]|uniref:Lipoprotein n=1 Tax=Myxococcus llanfairpwllgwyngyllgogerychwyrndrobwllllantysiliogogogochensis TaxID=2590453 RepID=A0A540X043_9BACT|nr:MULTISPECIES: hypothetical protein [Myxococcus]NTX01639.1 hypothetical protein [Myxococcus sp. CA040A]NTX40194.1 hypothetical protein [Myxococcus sp. CA033]TQF14606.1 hypothetical protein FJV41_17950 [Myxococcus llanfairpwllgwyngyllgogerychwyrndrobwllllantysiliogogogochensis]
MRPFSQSRLAPLFSSFVATLALFAAPASAEPVLLTCPGIVQAQYSPGMTNAPRMITSTASGTFGPCVGVPLSLLSTSFVAGGMGTLSCVGGSNQLGAQLNWSDGSVSHLDTSILITVRPLGEVVATYSGTVVGGRFQGASVLITFVLAQTQVLGCFTEEGVTATVGPTVLTITGS